VSFYSFPPVRGEFEDTLLTMFCYHRAEEDLYLAFWISKVSVNLMVEKVEKRCVISVTTVLHSFNLLISTALPLSSALSLRIYGVDVTPHAKGVPAPTGPGTASHSLNKKREVKEEETSGEGKESKQEDKDEVKQEAEEVVKTEEGQADAAKVEA